MAYRELTVRLERDKLPQIEALLCLAGASSLSLDDADDSPLFEPRIGEMPLWPSVVVRALFPENTDLDALAEMLRQSIERDLEVRIRSIGDEDWRRGLLQSIEPLDIGEGLRLLPAGEAPTVDCSRRCINLNMGLAFGTGRHPTTRLCLEWIDANPMHGLDVLDYGCGSGVLAIAALSLGAHMAWATDVDPQALLATEENATLNDLGDMLWAGPPDALPQVSPQVLFANILAQSLIELADRFRELLRPDARIVMSGILEHQIDLVTSAYETGFSDFELVCDDGWARIVGHRSA